MLSSFDIVKNISNYQSVFMLLWFYFKINFIWTIHLLNFFTPYTQKISYLAFCLHCNRLPLIFGVRIFRPNYKVLILLCFEFFSLISAIELCNLVRNSQIDCFNRRETKMHDNNKYKSI